MKQAAKETARGGEPDWSGRIVRLSMRNTPFDELSVGARARLERVCTAHDLSAYALAAGDANPLNRPGNDADHDGRDDALAPAGWIIALAGAALGSLLPGIGTVIRDMSMCLGPTRVRIGDRLAVEVECREKRAAPRAVFAITVSLVDGPIVAEGTAEIEAPQEAIELEGRAAPTLIIDAFDHFGPLIRRCRGLSPLVTAVVCPEDGASLRGTLLARDAGLITPRLIGARDRIEAAARTAGLKLDDLAIEDIADHAGAAARAVALVRAGEAGAIMKGNLHTDVLLAPVVHEDGLVIGRRISHCFAMDAPTLDHLLFISDAAINIAPDLMAKVDITQNAIDLARACGIERPKVGILSAIETVNPNIASTIDAAVLAKMAERGQITGGIVDGPLAMDNAIDVDAARTKGISSLVAGHAEILIVPNLEAGNMLAKELSFVGRAESAGLVVGARVPIILTSRADNDRARLASCALAQLYSYWRAHGEARQDPV